MLIHREGWLYSGRTPAFFSGQSGCYCCTPATGPLVYFYGVMAGGIGLRDVDSYVDDSWTSKTDATTPARSNAMASTVSQKAYVYGGISATSPYYMVANQEYVHSSDSFTAKTDMTASRYDSAGFSIDSKVYSFCGNDSTQTGTQTAYQYDPVADSWATKTDSPTPARYYCKGFFVGTNGYTVGGISTLAVVLKDTDEYSPSSNAWTAKTDLGTARFGAVCYTLGDYGFHCTGNSGAGTLQNLNDKYDATANTWTAAMVIDYLYSTPKRYFDAGGAPGFTSNGYVTGGQNVSGTAVSNHDQYADSDTWTQKTACPSPNRWHACAAESA